MFSQLYDSVFPALGAFFGFIATLANMTFAEFSDFMLLFPDPTQIGNTLPAFEFLNLFNGATVSTFSPMGLLARMVADSLQFFNYIDPLYWLVNWLESIFNVNLPYIDNMLPEIIHNVTSNFLNVILFRYLESFGLSPYSTPVWTSFLMFTPFLALGCGLLKIIWDVIPIF